MRLPPRLTWAFAGLTGAAAAGALIATCATPHEPARAAPPPAPVPADGSIRVVATPVPLNPDDPAQARLGELVYAGGVVLTSPDTSRLHGLSGLDIISDEDPSFIAVTDEGDLVRGDLVLDPSGRLVGVANVKLTPLRDERGAPFQGKEESDAEDVSYWGKQPSSQGPFAVSFERDHRVLLYERPGAPGRFLFRPHGDRWRRASSANGGMEALTEDCGGGLVGTEQGQIEPVWKGGEWLGTASSFPPPGYGLTALDRWGCERPLLALFRAYDPFRGSRIRISVLSERECPYAPNSMAKPDCGFPTGRRDLAELKPPLTVDNFEGMAVVETGEGRYRIYLLSDDNFQDSQRTLLLAFDWNPGHAGSASGAAR